MSRNVRLDISNDLSGENVRVWCSPKLKGFIFPTEFSAYELLES
ncbi:MAG TPA: hypothetical protein VJ372_25505 [Pyrinomonadaceae bacterium]|nr:hypothetical protein [Pyrinomonadaceae bacterium]